MKAPNAEMVGVAWLNWLPGLEAPAATSRPAPESWHQTGFVVASVVGSGHDPDTPGWRVPILSMDAWAYTPSSGKPPWGHAAGLAQIVWDAAEEGLVPAEPLPTLAGFASVRVASSWPVSEIRRVPEPDGSSFAHYSLDVALRWARVPA